MIENGDVVLNAVDAFLNRFVIYPSKHARVAHTLWIAHAHLMDYWDSTPRIAFMSPEPGSGKTRALEVTEHLVPNPVHAVNVTEAYLIRRMSDERGLPTILYDEIDTVFGPRTKDKNEGVRGIINSGHRQGATAGRAVSDKDGVKGKIGTEDLPSYCAVALAGLKDLPDTIMSRAVVVRMRRRSSDEKVEQWRLRLNQPEAEHLNQRLTAWTESVKPTLDAGNFWPDMPEGIYDRDADVWEALLVVADLAGGRWPTLARQAAVAMVAASKQRAPSMGVLLLADIKKVFDTAGRRDKLPTEDLLHALCAFDESPWATIRRGEPIDSRNLAERLKEYGIGSKNHRDGDKVFKGYSRDQFEDAWKRYRVPKEEEDDTVDDQFVTAVTAVTDSAERVCVGCNSTLLQEQSRKKGYCADCWFDRVDDDTFNASAAEYLAVG